MNQLFGLQHRGDRFFDRFLGAQRGLEPLRPRHPKMKCACWGQTRACGFRANSGMVLLLSSRDPVTKMKLYSLTAQTTGSEVFLYFRKLY